MCASADGDVVLVAECITGIQVNVAETRHI